MEEIEVAGLRVGFRRAGSGPPVVFVHGGFGFDSRSWEPQLEALADEFMVVAWDAPGAGRSSDPPESFRMPEYADCLAAFIAALGLDRPHIVGLSLGATLAIQLYDRHPTIPRTLVLAGAYAGWAGSLPADVVEQRLRKLLEETERPPARHCTRRSRRPRLWSCPLLATSATSRRPTASTPRSEPSSAPTPDTATCAQIGREFAQ